jgi:hypothetical protein
MKSCQHVGCRTGRATLEKSNQWHGGLLRAPRAAAPGLHRECRYKISLADVDCHMTLQRGHYYFLISTPGSHVMIGP